MDRWRQYLFESHSEATLRAWAKRLYMFRFFRAYGGHANDGDSLKVAYEYAHVANLHQFFGHLGVPLTTFTERPTQPEPGVAYTFAEFTKFPSLIPGTCWIRQPGHCSIAGQQVFVWCEANGVMISLGTDYRVIEAHVEAAEAIEKVLKDAPLIRVDPPVDNEHCICPKYYPAYFG
jgi:hypothetical protein